MAIAFKGVFLIVHIQVSTNPASIYTLPISYIGAILMERYWGLSWYTAGNGASDRPLFQWHEHI